MIRFNYAGSAYEFGSYQALVSALALAQVRGEITSDDYDAIIALPEVVAAAPQGSQPSRGSVTGYWGVDTPLPDQLG